MTFTDPESRHMSQLMAEIESQPMTVEPHTLRAQRELKERWERKHPRTYMLPGEKP